VQVDISPPSTLRQSISTGKVSFQSEWIADYPDAENYLSLFYSKNFSPMGQTIPILK
jgi:peptide/nickel transport system substrate-binding protein